MSKTKLCFNSSIYNNDSVHNVMVLSSSSQFNKGCSRNRINSKFNLRNNSKQNTERLFQLDTISLSHGKSNNKSKDKKFHSLHTVQSSRNVNRNYFNIQQSYITTLKGQQQIHQRNNTEINNNTSSMYMGNYNIKDCILRGNTDLVNKKKHILKLKTKNKQKPLSVILINTNNKKHKSNSVDAHPRTSINKIQQHKLTYVNNIMLTHNNNNILSHGKSNTFIKRCKSFKIKTTTIKRTQHTQTDIPNSLSDHNIFHNNKNSNKTNSYTSLLSKFLYYINNRKENILTKKEMFKLLKIDIYKNEQKVKEMLDSLKRIQQHNDEDLKRKGFVKNIGFLACQNKI